MKITAAGDMIIGRRIPADFEGYAELAPIIEQGDARFFNLETTLHHEGECFASETSGGTYLRTNPEVLEDIKKFGFNMTSFNNNHVADYGFDGMLRTLDAVEASGLVHAGVGRNLAEASAPRYLDTAKGRVAMISVNSTIYGEMLAGEQTARIKGRPGINPLRVVEHMELDPTDFATIKQIIDKTGINIQHNIEKNEGYHGGTANKNERFGKMTLVPANETKFVQKANKADLDRVKKAIYEAKLQADYIFVSLHAHEMGGTEKEEPAEFLKDFAHFCIDNGANAVVGHGPHLLRPIEIYNGCPIFYSLGDFAIELYNVEFAPQEMYDQYGMTGKETVHELLKKRSNDFSIGLMTDHRMFEAIIPLWETDEEGKLTSLTIYPILAPMTGKKSEIGLPRLAKDASFLCGFLRRCEAYGTKFVPSTDGSYRCIL
ncbi:MAG: CapA family protein [Clostridia bacterium]|nr:CapA family protein [Clostridia bacterium]